MPPRAIAIVKIGTIASTVFVLPSLMISGAPSIYIREIGVDGLVELTFWCGGSIASAPERRGGLAVSSRLRFLRNIRSNCNPTPPFSRSLCKRVASPEPFSVSLGLVQVGPFPNETK